MNAVEWLLFSLNAWGAAGDLATQDNADDDEAETEFQYGAMVGLGLL